MPKVSSRFVKMAPFEVMGGVGGMWGSNQCGTHSHFKVFGHLKSMLLQEGRWLVGDD